MSTMQPSDDELKAALVSIRADNPLLGFNKVYALLLATHSGWTVSEKRTRKVLQTQGLMLGNAARIAPDCHDAGSTTTITRPFTGPSSNPTRGLQVKQWTNKVVVKQFGTGRGKGLIATTGDSDVYHDRGNAISQGDENGHCSMPVAIASGEVIWKEDPWVVAPEWDVFDLQWCSPTRACAHCTTPFKQTGNAAAKLIIACPFTVPSKSLTAEHCTARFCNRLCLSRAQATHHPLLCPAQNPAGARLVRWARTCEWLAVHALAKVVAKVLLGFQRATGVGAADEEMDVVRGWAAMGMEERAKCGGFEPDREVWKKVHELFMQAFREPPDPRERRMLSRILTKPVPDNVYRELFVDYDTFLVGLGRMSLNMEAHGGLYVLHSHLNHSCDPNVSVRHLDKRTALARITVLARRDIRAEEELTVAYVDPAMSLRNRRAALMEWGFGVCRCERCVREEAEGAAHGEEGTADGMGDLERELKAGLGLT